jgi:ABC-type siderophore export system fused ATPase/permease subunit
MKILLKIVGVLALLISLALGFLAITRTGTDMEAAMELEAKMTESKNKLNEMAKGDAESEKIMKKVQSEMEGEVKKLNIPSSNTFLLLMLILGIILVLSLVSGIFLFVAKKTATTAILGILVVLSLIAYVMSPDLGDNERKYTARANNKQVALLAGIPAIIVAACAFGNARIAKK